MFANRQVDEINILRLLSLSQGGLWNKSKI